MKSIIRRCGRDIIVTLTFVDFESGEIIDCIEQSFNVEEAIGISADLTDAIAQARYVDPKGKG